MQAHKTWFWAFLHFCPGHIFNYEMHFCNFPRSAFKDFCITCPGRLSALEVRIAKNYDQRRKAGWSSWGRPREPSPRQLGDVGERNEPQIAPQLANGFEVLEVLPNHRSGAGPDILDHETFSSVSAAFRCAGSSLLSPLITRANKTARCYGNSMCYTGPSIATLFASSGCAAAWADIKITYLKHASQTRVHAEYTLFEPSVITHTHIT